MKSKIRFLTIIAAVFLLGAQAFAEGASFSIDSTPAQAKVIVGSKGGNSSMESVYAAAEVTDMTLSQEDARAILGTGNPVDVYMTEVGLFLADGTNERVSLADGASFYATFYVPGVNYQSNVIVRHWTGNGNYEDIRPALGEGCITVSVRSLSPLAVIVDNTAVQAETAAETAAQTAPAGNPSPPTGDTGAAPLWGGAALAALCLIVYLISKRRRFSWI